MRSFILTDDEWRGFSVNLAISAASFFIAVFAGCFLPGWTGVNWGIALYIWPATFILLAWAYRRGWVDPIREIVMLPFALIGVALGFTTQWILQ